MHPNIGGRVLTTETKHVANKRMSKVVCDRLIVAFMSRGVVYDIITNDR